MDPILVESLDQIPEQLKTLFKEHADGGFVLEFPKGEDVSGLKSAKEKLARELKQAKDRLGAFNPLLQSDDGDELTVEQLQELIGLGRQAKTKGGDGKGNDDVVPRSQIPELINKEKAQLTKKFETETTKLTSEIQSLRQQLDENLIYGGIRADANSPELGMRLKPGAVNALIRAAKADGVFKVHEGKAVVWDKENDTPMAGNKGDVSIIDWMKDQLAGEMSYLVEESTGSGASQGSGTGSRTVREKATKDMSDEEKREYINAKGLKAWQEKLIKERGLTRRAA